MSPPSQDGTCGPQDVEGRRWGRFLARTGVFGCLFVVAGAVVCVVYVLVYLSLRGK